MQAANIFHLSNIFYVNIKKGPRRMRLMGRKPWRKTESFSKKNLKKMRKLWITKILYTDLTIAHDKRKKREKIDPISIFYNIYVNKLMYMQSFDADP